MKQDCFEIIKDMAFVNLAVHCEVTKVDLEFDEVPSDPVEEWAARAAEYALKLGWGCDENQRVVCPDHRARDGS
jgi:hypothetical protein